MHDSVVETSIIDNLASNFNRILVRKSREHGFNSFVLLLIICDSL